MSAKSEFSVAVVGATGLVGETMVNVLEERNFPVSELYALASNRSLGKSVSFRGRSIAVQELEGFDFSKVDIGLFSPGASVSRVYAPKAAAAGCGRGRERIRARADLLFRRASEGGLAGRIP